MPEKINIVAVVGPTASGKTALAASLAKEFGGEVVSADSMQIYKGMNIGTAKPSEEEMLGVPHHLLGFAEPDEKFSVASFKDMAGKCIAEIAAKGKLPFVAGGTGLYIDSLLKNIEFTSAQTDFQLRKSLFDKAEKEGVQSLLEELRAVDPKSAELLHENDLTRIVRALEIYKLTGVTATRQKELSRLNETPYNSVYIGLDASERSYLYDRINLRVDIMMKNGLLEEAEEYWRGNPQGTSVQAIGYKELKPYLEGEKSLDECVELLKQSTRRYAKRQLTWFRRNKNIHWLYIDENTPEELIAKASDIINRSFYNEQQNKGKS